MLRQSKYAMLRFLTTHPRWFVRYLAFARWCCDHGVRPPLTGSSELFLRLWREQSMADGCYSPQFYEKADNTLNLLFQDVLPLLEKGDPILEVGCNCGRSLNYLHERGFTNLRGIEIGQAAVDRMKEIFPATYQAATVEVGSAPDVLLGHPSRAYELVFCHSVLVNIPAQFNFVFREMARVSRRFIVTIENEASFTSYPRNFQKMFEREGFKMVAWKYLVQHPKQGVTLVPDRWSPEMQLSNNVLRIFVRKDQ